MSNELVPIQQEGDVYAIMDQLDDQQIQAAIESRISPTWVYTFKADGRPQTGLSKVGVDACCSQMALGGHVIREGEPQMSLDPTNPEYVLFTCPASRFEIKAEDGREILYDIVSGVKRQWIKMRLRDGRIVEDPFWFEKGAMKAARNARSRLIPEKYKEDIIKLALKDKKKERVHVIATRAATTSAPPAKAAAPAPAAKQAAPAPDTEKITPSQVIQLWRIARESVDNDEGKAQTAVKKLLKFVDSQSETSIQATGDLTNADFDRICTVLSFDTVPKEWIGKLEWGDKPAPAPAPKDEAPF
jgi:hypothetical protein